MRFHFSHTLLWRLLLPVILFGSLFSFLLYNYLTPPLVSTIERRIDKTINHTANMAIKICEERLYDMLDLRLEENEEMNSAAKKEAIAEIKEITGVFPNMRVIIFDNDGLVQAASFPLPPHSPKDLQQNLATDMQPGTLSAAKLFGSKIMFSHRYFPFWRWNIVSFIPEDEYLQPIKRARHIVIFGNVGTLLAVVVSVVLLFLMRINQPLRKIIQTTRKVREGNFDKVSLRGNGEIEQVAVAFDTMVDKLRDDRIEIDRILKELSESEEKYRILSENSLTLVLVVNNGIFQYFNKAATTFFQRTSADLQRTDIFSLFSGSQELLLRQRMGNLVEDRSAIEHFELSCTMPSGEEKWLEILASKITYQGEGSVLIHALDISQRKSMEKERENLREKITRGEQMRMLGTLAGGVAHDLNNILSGLVSYPDLLLQNIEPGDPLHAPLKTIRQSGEKAAAIVQDLLTLTRRGVVITDIVNLRDIVNNYLTSPECQQLLSSFPAVRISTDFPEEVMNIKGSAHHLSKSVMNLVTNSAEAMPDGGEIGISLENSYIDVNDAAFPEAEEGEYVTLSVRDSGEGISKEDLNKIFEPFYTRKVMGRSGTGLGMSVVWGTVNDLKGFIDVKSREGEGTTFTLYFPATRAPLTKELPEEAIASPPGAGERILVVDDVEEQRLIASSMLEGLAYTVDTAESGEEALRMIADGARYDLILLDMIMDPGMDGLDTYREILRIVPKQKAIIASGFSETARVRSTMLLGAGSYIKKPYNLNTLAAILRSSLRPDASITD